MRSYRRRLPHCDAPACSAFVTWRLLDSLPRERSFDSGHLTSGRVFVTWDRLLDTARTGPLYLRRPEIARAGGRRWRVYDRSPGDHAQPRARPVDASGFASGSASQGKGPAARRANQLQGTAGPFWQDEYFDPTVRNGQERRRICRYIEWNPVRAALATSPDQFIWSSAYREDGRG